MVWIATELMVVRRIQEEIMRGRAYQPRIERHVVLLSWAGGLAVGLTIALGQAMRCLHHWV